jgi:peptide methionine sulfoxide reductase msrA/msrB
MQSGGIMGDSAIRTIYLAGGCFWGVEELFRQIAGVVGTCVGYANGTGVDDATYQRVCEGDTGFRETVEIRFDPAVVTVEQLLWAYFHIIDPTVAQRQGNDVGDQYQTGIYWRPQDAELGAVLMRLAEQERERVQASGRRFLVEVKELSNFFAAEDYHQRYLVKNPNGYCHVSLAEMREVLETLGESGR